ncbi:hypothetical protein KC356_g41 [Hortaea werneckii]|nr:hypothetical protein KC356_g41 [Hortaea werneckii]
MLPPGWPPFVSSTGGMSESVVLADTTSSFVAPLLSCTSWRKTRSGVRKYVTIWAEMSSSVAELGERFSTLYWPIVIPLQLFLEVNFKPNWYVMTQVMSSKRSPSLMSSGWSVSSTGESSRIPSGLASPSVAVNASRSLLPVLTIDALPEVQTVKLWLEVPSTKEVTSLYASLDLYSSTSPFKVTMSPISTLLRPESPKTNVIDSLAVERGYELVAIDLGYGDCRRRADSSTKGCECAKSMHCERERTAPGWERGKETNSRSYIFEQKAVAATYWFRYTFKTHIKLLGEIAYAVAVVGLGYMSFQRTLESIDEAASFRFISLLMSIAVML